MAICKKCGKCCKISEGVIPATDWWKSESIYLELTKKQKQTLKTERAKYPVKDGFCEMAIDKNREVLCLIEYKLGRDLKPKKCRDWVCWIDGTLKISSG